MFEIFELSKTKDILNEYRENIRNSKLDELGVLSTGILEYIVIIFYAETEYAIKTSFIHGKILNRFDDDILKKLTSTIVTIELNQIKKYLMTNIGVTM